jgi:hypothetical protein
MITRAMGQYQGFRLIRHSLNHKKKNRTLFQIPQFNPI